jgi:hypothetical protein
MAGRGRGAVVDLSLGGCSFAFPLSPEDEPPEIDKGVDAVLSMHVPGLQGERPVGLRTINIRREDHRITIGSQFQDLDADTRNAIESYIQTTAALRGLADE